MKEKNTGFNEKMKNKLFHLLRKAIEGDSLLWVNEITANLLSQLVMTLLIIILVITWVLNMLDIFKMDHLMIDEVCLGNVIMLSIGVFLMWYFKGSKRWIKHMALAMICLTINSCLAFLGFRATLAICIPVILSTRYLSFEFTRNVGIFTAFLSIIGYLGYCFLGVSVDYDVVSAPCDMLFHKGLPMDQAELVSALSSGKYMKDMMLNRILPDMMIFLIVCVVCCEVSRIGYRLMEEQRNISAQHAAIDAELNIAKRIQEHALPITHELSEHPSFDLAASMEPAKEIGGDFYDFLMIDETHLALVIADVSGKGVPAAMFMMVSKILLDNTIQGTKTAGEILTDVNHLLCEKNLDDMFVTVWLGIVDLETGEMTTANGGHEYPLIRKKDGRFEIFKDKHGFVLGGMDGMRYRETNLKLEPGDTVFVYTDGVPEATNNKGEFFGLERTCQALEEIGVDSMKELLGGLSKKIEEFADEEPQFDDITMVGFRLNYLLKKEGIMVQPDKDSIPQVQNYLEEQMEAAEVPMKKLNRMNIAVDEIYSNIVYYSRATWAKVSCDVDNEKIVVSFVDNGIPYNPLEKEETDVNVPLEERELGGLGILMTVKLMDDVEYHYEDGKNYNSLTLKL